MDLKETNHIGRYSVGGKAILQATAPSNSALKTDLVGLRHTSKFGNIDPSVRRLQK